MFRSQIFLENFILPLTDKVNKSPFLSKLKEWRKISLYSRKELDELQCKKLQALLEHASSKAEFYRLLSISPKKDPYAWLAEFPVLPKTSFREHLPLFLTIPENQNLTSIMSSGSSGPPSKVYFNKEELANNRALQVLWWEWAGYSFGNSILQTGVNMNRSKEKKIKDFLLQTHYINAMSHSDNEIEEELKRLVKEPRDHFIAYASSLFLFAKVAIEKGIEGVKFKSVISLGEKLLPNFRETIEKAFSCQVYDTYGASEGFLIASQCQKGNYHILSPHVVLEILDDHNREVKPGEMGRVVLTGLDNFTTPLIRYEVGDLAVKSVEKDCSCGLNYPLLGEIIGRQTEFILTKKGKYITVQNVVRVMKHFPEVEQFKVVQDQEDSIRIIYIKDPNAPVVRESEIQQMFEEVFQEPMTFIFESVNVLPKAKTGKFQLIERNIP